MSTRVGSTMEPEEVSIGPEDFGSSFSSCMGESGRPFRWPVDGTVAIEARSLVMKGVNAALFMKSMATLDHFGSIIF